MKSNSDSGVTESSLSDADADVEIPDAIGTLAEEFIQQYRLGLNPNIEAYCHQHPECADRIRALFPMLLMVEDCGVAVSIEQAEAKSYTQAGRPERIGDFKIVREIGRGGMGIVYEAEQQSLRRRVALKVLPPSATLSPSTIERFRRESRAAARLHHSNIVPIFGVGEDDGLHYYVMQFIQGVGLDQVLIELAESRRAQLLGNNEARIKGVPPGVPTGSTSKANIASGSEERLYWHRVAIIGLQLANALHFAHTQGVLHRDVKPANVLLDSDGLIWLTDFGLAHASDDVNLTRSGDIVGTLRYLAPERLHGEGDQLSDVYGLGATLYELLALVPAFPESDRVTLIRQIAHHEPKRLRSIDPSIPRDLETIVLKAIEKEASCRYASAGELAEDLSRYLSDRPILARRVVKLEQLWRWCRRNPTTAILSSAVCLLLLGMSIAWSMVSWVQNDRDRARQAERSAKQSQQSAKLAEEFAKARSHLALAIGYRHSREPGHKSKCLAEIEAAMTYNPPAETQVELRNLTIAALAQTDVKPGRSWHVWQDDTKCVAHDNELTRFARMNSKGIVSILDAHNLVEIGSIALPAADRVLLSDRGEFLVAYSGVDNTSFEVWDVGRSERVLGPLSGSWDFDFDDQRKKLLVWKGDVALHLYDLETGHEIQQYAVTSMPTAAALSPDGDQVAFVLEDQPSILHVLELSSGQVAKKLTIDGSIHFCSWAPRGTQIACSLIHPTNLEIWDLPNEKKISTMIGHTQPVAMPCFTADGNFVTTGSWDGTLRVWETNTGVEVAVLTDGSIYHSGNMNVVATRTEDGIVSSTELDLPSGFARYANGNSAKPTRFECGAVSPNGRWLVAGSTDGLEVWDLERGKMTTSRPGTMVRMLQVDWNTKRFQTVSDGVGFESWPIEELDGGWRIGSPKSLDVESANVAHCSATPDGSRCALVNDSGVARVLDSSGKLIRQISTPDGHQLVSISPNGKLLATFGWHAPTSSVWEVDSGRLLHTQNGYQTFHSFSPDSRLLITSSRSDYTMRSIKDWKIVRRIERKDCVYPSSVAYSSDGSKVAMELSWGVMHLLRTDNFETLAILESPKRTRPSHFQFLGNNSAVSNTLFTFHTLTAEAHRWEIDELRQHLRSRHLDWDDHNSNLSLVNDDVPQSPGTALRVDMAEPKWFEFSQLESSNLDQMELGRQRITEAERSFYSNPSSPLHANQLAWYLVSGPSELNDAERALSLLKTTLQSKDFDVNNRNTLAIAHYRCGKFEEAIELLRVNITLQEDVDLPYDLYFLAMCYWKLGNQDKARETLEWSERMLRLKPPLDVESQGELHRFRAEAKALIK